MRDIKLVYLRSKIRANDSFLDAQREEVLKGIVQSGFKLSESGSVYFFIESGGTEEEFRQIFKRYKAPYFLIATSANNSLPASLEITSFLHQQNLESHLIHGQNIEIGKLLLSEQQLSKRADYLCKKTSISNLNCRLGVVGKPSDWLISSNVNYEVAKNRFGVELIDVPFQVFKSEIDKKIIPENADQFHASIAKYKIKSDVIEGALYIYSALKRIILDYKLDGLTVRCFDLLGTYRNTSCLALALLNQEGYTATCEGDVPAMISMYIIKQRFNQPSFQANPSLINPCNHKMILAHCTLPFSMCESVSYNTHFESGLGIGIKGEMELGPITIFKFSSDLNRYCCFDANINKNLSFANLCRTQIEISAQKEDLKSILCSPCGNHLIVFYGHHAKEIIEFLS